MENELKCKYVSNKSEFGYMEVSGQCGYSDDDYPSNDHWTYCPFCGKLIDWIEV